MLTSSFGALIHKHCGSQRTKTHSPNIKIKTASILTCFMISVESQIWITAPYSNVTWVTIGRWFEGAWERMSPSLLAKWTQCFALVNLPPSPLYPLEAESMKEHRGCLDDCVHSLWLTDSLSDWGLCKLQSKAMTLALTYQQPNCCILINLWCFPCRSIQHWFVIFFFS